MIGLAGPRENPKDVYPSVLMVSGRQATATREAWPLLVTHPATAGGWARSEARDPRAPTAGLPSFASA